MDSEYFLTVFDLHLILFRTIKEEFESKIDFNVKIEVLYKLSLLKSYRYPFFMFRDNRLKSKLSFDVDIYQKIMECNNQNYLIYKYHLPRYNPLTLMKIEPDVEQYFQTNKLGINRLNKLQLDPLISEKENLDWFIYDDESLKFLMEMEKTDYYIEESIKHTEDEKIFFEDKYKNMMLLSRDYKSFFINMHLNTVSPFNLDEYEN
jgi:hypothetical protein